MWRAAGPGELTRIEIGPDRRGIALGIRQGHVTVGAHQIEGVRPQAARTHFPMPGKDVQRQFSLFTHRLKLSSDVAVHVDLPVERAQRREVVLRTSARIGLHPGQTVAALHRSLRVPHSSCFRGS